MPDFFGSSAAAAATTAANKTSNNNDSNNRSLGLGGDGFGLTITLGLSLVYVLVKNNSEEITNFCKSAVKCCSKAVAAFTGEKKSKRNKNKKNDQEPTQDDMRIVRHKGACHCTAVAFYITAPRTLPVHEGTGKLPFPRTVVKAKHFVLKQGHESLRIYYLGTSTAAHTFCSQCGVHLLYAPHPQAKIIYLNVDCLQPGTFQRKMMPKQQINDYEQFEDPQIINNPYYADTTDEEDNENIPDVYDDYVGTYGGAGHGQHRHEDKREKPKATSSYDYEGTTATTTKSSKILTSKNGNRPVSPLLFDEAPPPTTTVVVDKKQQVVDTSDDDDVDDQFDDDELTKSRRRRQQNQYHYHSDYSQPSSRSWNMVKPPPPVPMPAGSAEKQYRSHSSSSYNHESHQQRRFSSDHRTHKHSFKSTVIETNNTDDISEPTIPLDLASTAEETMTSMGDNSVRSSITDATARDLRMHMRKYIKRQERSQQYDVISENENNNSSKSNQHQDLYATCSSTQSSSGIGYSPPSSRSIINDAMEEEASDFLSAESGSPTASGGGKFHHHRLDSSSDDNYDPALLSPNNTYQHDDDEDEVLIPTN